MCKFLNTVFTLMRYSYAVGVYVTVVVCRLSVVRRLWLTVES